MVKRMKKIATGIILLIFFGIAGAVHFKEKNMFEIKFALGDNIIATAKRTGIPEFNVSNVDGLIQYQVMQLPSDAIVVYDKPGYEIRSNPVFSLNFRADRARSPNDIVYAFRVKLETDTIQSHSSAQELIKSLLNQFKKGKWQRRVAATCPAVTGRSSYLNSVGEIDIGGCGLDPDFRISNEEWTHVFATKQNYEWLGDNTFAQLTVGYSQDARGLTYDIVLNFEDYKTKTAIAVESENRRLQEGDAKGWNSSADAAIASKATAEKIKILEANALKRGDQVIKRTEAQP
jgi:hypothetical protein